LKIHAVILARGGSKAIPRKNVLDFCGFPLLAWTVNCALRCSAVESVWVSTDDAEIAKVAHCYGAGIIERPDSISGDAASSESALIHAASAIPKRIGLNPTHFFFLQPTSPLREVWELDQAVVMFQQQNLDSLFSAAPAEDFCLWSRSENKLSSLNFDYRNRARRQDRPDSEVWIETGSFYITSIEGLVNTGNRLHGKIGMQPVESWKAFEIDSPEGLELCRSIFSARLFNVVPHPENKI